MARTRTPTTVRSDLALAYQAANRGEWTKARQLADVVGNPSFKLVIEWRYLIAAGQSAGFDELNAFLTSRVNWPRHEMLIMAAERAMPPTMDPKQVVDWYKGRTPSSAEGKIRLGEALLDSGKSAEGVDLIRKAWIEGSFLPTQETQILQAHSGILSDIDQRARLDSLLARDDINGARRQLLLVDTAAQRLAQARIRIKESPALTATVLAGVAPDVRDNPELLFDAARAYRRRRQDEDAWTAMLEMPADKTPILSDERWTERHIMARDALKAGKYEVAYQLAARHGQQTGGGFADAEFLAGWIALRYLHEPELALNHFQTLAKGVNLPISKARAYYWLARTEEELKRLGDAVADYKRASEHRDTFYGQLALARIEDAPALNLQTAALKPTRAEQVAFDSDERVGAMRVLAELNDRDNMRLFAIRMANDPPDPKRLQMLAQLMLSLGDPAMGVRVAKLASYNNVVLVTYLAPTMALPQFPGRGTPPEPSFVLGITRQESEFDPNAVSGAGARGLMQLMPSSAHKTASVHGLVYRPNDLIAKPEYNMQIGMAALSDELDYYGGSYILAIASYNAGPGNVNKWIEAYGDPRDPNVDPIDWVELIPFAETRNYVQRVLENIEVYRTRLNGESRLNILADLYRPNAPKVAVLKYQPPAVAAAPAPPPAAVPLPQPKPGQEAQQAAQKLSESAMPETTLSVQAPVETVGAAP